MGNGGGRGERTEQEEQKGQSKKRQSGVPGCSQVTVGQSLDKMLTVTQRFASVTGVDGFTRVPGMGSETLAPRYVMRRALSQFL